MPTDTRRAAPPASSFAIRLVAWSLGLFGLFRLPWIGTHFWLPLTLLQADAGAAALGPSSLPVEATLACSGADALALCFAAIFAYPAPWRMRAAGAALGAGGLLVLNTIRIGTLGRIAASPRWFDTLHVYIWPAIITIGIAGFVFAWMCEVDRRRAAARAPTLQATPEHGWPATRRLALTAALFLLLFTLASPLYLGSPHVLLIAERVARAAANLLSAIGVGATATAGLLQTPHGAFLVTQECLATPLIPVYFAGVVVYSRTWWTAALWTAASLPLFVALGIARLLVVAIPAEVGASPAFFIHAFSQLLVAAGLVCGLAVWRTGVHGTTALRAALALAIAVAFVRWLGPPYTDTILAFSAARTPVEDAQGALMFLPSFQFALFLALWVAAFAQNGWVRLLSGALLLMAAQVAVASGVHLLAVHFDIVPLVRDIRAWALLGPGLVIAAVVNVALPRR